MKVLDVDHLHDGLTRNINRMNRLEKEMTAIQKAVEELTNMEEALKGEGGQAIRDFYTSCHLPFLQYFLSFKEEFNTILQQAQQALSSLEPMDDGHIVEEFLETTVEEGLTASADITTALTDEANAIMDEVADIVGLPKLDDTLVHESIADAKTKRDDTVEALHTFDSTQTAQLLPIETSIQSMKEWVKNIEGLFQAGLTDVDFPADTWSAMASRSSLGMAIAAQQAPVGSVAHALHEQNQLTLMLQASLSNMAPIRFGFGGFAQKSYPTYGPVMLGLGNLSPGNQTSETVQQVSKSSDPDLEEIYAALAKQAEGMDVSSPSSPRTYSAKEEITYEGMRKVLGGNGSGTPDGLALYAKSMGPSAKYVFDFFTEDIRTILDPEATAVEKAMAIGFTFFKPAKLLDKAGDVAGAAKDAGKAVEDVKSTGKAVDKGTDNSVLKHNYSANSKNHLIKPEGVNKTGVSGGHNEKEFFNYLDVNGIPYKVEKKEPHPSVSGIYDVYYKIAKQERGVYTNEFKAATHKKTVYDENIFTDEQMYKYGQEAMNNGTEYLTRGGQQVIQGTSNGLKFEGWKNPTTGEIESVYPVIEWKKYSN